MQNLAGAVSGATQGFAFNDTRISASSPGLTVGVVDGVTGITTLNGAISVATASQDLTISNNVSAGSAAVSLKAGNGTGGGTERTFTNSAAITGNAVTIAGDKVLLNGTVNSGAGTTTVTTSTVNRTISVGVTGDLAGTMSLSQAELNTITRVPCGSGRTAPRAPGT